MGNKIQCCCIMKKKPVEYVELNVYHTGDDGRIGNNIIVLPKSFEKKISELDRNDIR